MTAEQELSDKIQKAISRNELKAIMVEAGEAYKIHEQLHFSQLMFLALTAIDKMAILALTAIDKMAMMDKK